MFLLDTNVVSQRPKPRPDRAVALWLLSVPAESLRISVVTIQEVRFGIESLAAGPKRDEIEAWLEKDLLIGFGDRVLPVDAAVADVCGRLLADMKRKRYTPSPNDALIAATAIAHGLTLATLNRKHFEKLGVELVKF